VNRISIKPKVSPADIEHRLEERFRRSAELDAKGVEVKVDGATVTLKGTVSSWDEFDEADWAAWSAAGVEKVKNQLRVANEALSLI
jgi:osmotically-inducible protein OsmY